MGSGIEHKTYTIFFPSFSYKVILPIVAPVVTHRTPPALAPQVFLQRRREATESSISLPESSAWSPKTHSFEDAGP